MSSIPPISPRSVDAAPEVQPDRIEARGLVIAEIVKAALLHLGQQIHTNRQMTPDQFRVHLIHADLDAKLAEKDAAFMEGLAQLIDAVEEQMRQSVPLLPVMLHVIAPGSKDRTRLMQSQLLTFREQLDQKLSEL
ncbi:MAG: hypothetical protein KDK78_04395 [Chlamydiia bacterium]|nr:hypothetical protein [Chlamydiia bacterium]